LKRKLLNYCLKRTARILLGGQHLLFEQYLLEHPFNPEFAEEEANEDRKFQLLVKLGIILNE